jgi:uncharacterized protein (DUF2342 family)
MVVLDACADASGEVARAALGPNDAVLEISARNVGAARAAGFAHALASRDAPEPERLWLATTDADTLVSSDWLARQLALAEAGYEAVAGAVEVQDWSEQPPAVRARYLAHYRAGSTPDGGHRHAHGANLGLTGQAYLAAGGVPPLPLAEDRALIERLAAAGRLARARSVRVVTSARQDSRATGGFGDFLRSLG